MASSAEGLLSGAPTTTTTTTTPRAEPSPQQRKSEAPSRGKNAVLVAMLVAALVLTALGVHCEVAAPCDAVARVATPRHLLYAGLVVVLAWCCCPCFKLDCHDVDLENRSCFLRAVQRRRRLRRARALGVPSAADDEEQEP